MISTDTSANLAVTATRRADLVRRARRRPAVMWCMVYLALSAVVFVTVGSGWVALSHLVLLAALWWSMTSDHPLARLFGDLSPIIIASAITYGEVPLLIRAFGTAYHDDWAQRFE